MSRADNKFLDFYRVNPEVTKEIRHLANGNKRDFRKLYATYQRRPEIFEEVLETAQHDSSIMTERDVINHIENENRNPTSTHINPYATGAVGAITGFIASGTLFPIIATISNLPFNQTNLLMYATITTVGTAIGGRKAYSWASRIKQLHREYATAKEQVDKILGAKRVRGNDQLELLFH